MAIYFSIAAKLVQGVEIYLQNSVLTTQEVQIVVSQPANLF